MQHCTITEYFKTKAHLTVYEQRQLLTYCSIFYSTKMWRLR